MALNVAISALIDDLTQKGLIKRVFHDSLYPKLQYRMEATAEEWDAAIGTEIVETRAGLLKPNAKPAKPGVDPQPQSSIYEQWTARMDPYNGAMDTHMPTANTAAANLFLRDVKNLGLQAAMSVDRAARNTMFTAYLSGQTVLVDAAAAGDQIVHVSALNGFVDVVNLGSTARPAPVSPTNPLSITILNAGVPIVRNVIAAQPDDPYFPLGPGWLTLSVAMPVGGSPARSPVLSVYRPRVLRVGGGRSVDALAAGDMLDIQTVINTAAILRTFLIPPHPDGTYHAHICPTGNAQFFTDPVFQNLHKGVPDAMRYAEGFMGSMSGISFFQNTESPNKLNSGSLIQTGDNAMFAEDIGSEVINESGVQVGRVLVTGASMIYEKWFNQAQNITEAGINGKAGAFDISNNDEAIEVARIQLMIRAPQDRLGDMVSSAWKFAGGWPVPSDLTALAGQMRFRRGLVIEYAESLLDDY